ncbi:hypothetical protein [Nitrosomonas sp.]|uniref:hypothetical protein n=1 Tax=Nitrosomonas sp. TaxID=42353 RepID=UPI00272F3ED6|nr:hypothetical protein [Nitrosomonas sp.]MDP1786733.1 hypothetical protein [Nitrosomonas sp.]
MTASKSISLLSLSSSSLREARAKISVPVLWLLGKTQSGKASIIRALTGNRDRMLVDAPDLNYAMAAEILFLIETLEKPR